MSNVFDSTAASDAPKSEPTPRMLPLSARRAPSPPLEPPEVRPRLSGFSVRPKTLLFVSAAIMVCGKLVLQ